MKGRTLWGIVGVAAVIALVGIFVLQPLAEKYGLNWGTYYTKVDNAYATQQPSGDGETWSYSLPAYNADGNRIDVRFLAGKQLREGAVLKLEMLPFRGVVDGEGADPSPLPAATAGKLGIG